MSSARDEEEHRLNLSVSPEQFRTLFDLYPKDPVLIAEACRQAGYDIHVPRKTGRWEQHDARVYIDDGFQGSGYLLVHWSDVDKVPNCPSNGMCTDRGFGRDAITWDDQPERDRLMSIQENLWHWMRPVR